MFKFWRHAVRAKAQRGNIGIFIALRDKISTNHHSRYTILSFYPALLKGLVISSCQYQNGENFQTKRNSAMFWNSSCS